MFRKARSPSGFTLIELLVVIAVIAVLISLLLPAVQKVREAANRTKCTNNIKQLMLALHAYHDVYKVLPPGASKKFRLTSLGFQYRLYPFIEQDNIYRVIQESIDSGTSSWQATGITTRIPTLMCPSDPTQPKSKFYSSGAASFHTNYVGCAGNSNFPDTPNEATINGIFFHLSTTRLADVTDGTSNTFAIGELLVINDAGSLLPDFRGNIFDCETANSCFSTVNPPNSSVGDRGIYCVDSVNAPCQPNAYISNVQSLRSMHRGGVHVSYVDGAVRFVSDNVDPIAYKAAGSRNKGETVVDF